MVLKLQAAWRVVACFVACSELSLQLPAQEGNRARFYGPETSLASCRRPTSDFPMNRCELEFKVREAQRQIESPRRGGAGRRAEKELRGFKVQLKEYDDALANNSTDGGGSGSGSSSGGSDGSDGSDGGSDGIGGIGGGSSGGISASNDTPDAAAPPPPSPGHAKYAFAIVSCPNPTPRPPHLVPSPHVP